MERCKNFPRDVSDQLRTYVYRLIDPRNGETFYVGKGKGDRVFAHIRAEANLKGDELDNKMARIREISLAGLEVGHFRFPLEHSYPGHPTGAPDPTPSTLRSVPWRATRRAPPRWRGSAPTRRVQRP